MSLFAYFTKQKFFTYLKAPSYCFQHLSPLPICILHLGGQAEAFKPVSLAPFLVYPLAAAA